MGVWTVRGRAGVEAGAGRGVDAGDGTAVAVTTGDVAVDSAGLPCAWADGADGTSKVTAPSRQICSRFCCVMSNSIVPRRGFGGSGGRSIALPFIFKVANGALERA